MATFNPVYRMTVFAPGSETTVFTPAATAPHSDDFKVATAQGITGFQPYMGIPRGRKSRWDPVTSKLDIGAITVNLLDVRTTAGGTNLQRWVTGFIGDDEGKARMIGLKAAVEESTDGGSTFAPYYVGRIRQFDLDGLLQYKLQIKEENDLQKIIKAFEGEPSASMFDHDNGGYANRRQVMPLGPDIDYGPHNALAKPTGKWIFAKSDRNRAIAVDRDSEFNAVPGRIYVSKPLLDRVEHEEEDAWKRETEGRTGPIVRVMQGATVGRFYLTYAKFFLRSRTEALAGIPASLHSMLLEEIDSNAFEYAPLSTFAVGSDITFQILFEDEPTENVPLLLDNVHPVKFWNDILHCRFSRLNNQTGVSLFSGSIEVDQDAFDTLIADGQFKNSRWLITEPDEIGSFVEKNILRPYGLGYRLEPTESGGRFRSQVVPFSTALPRSLAGLQTITQDDLVDGSKPTWVPGKPFINFETTFYTEQISTIENLIANNSEENKSVFGPENPTLVREFATPFITIDLDNVHGNGGNFKVDARGIRYFPYEIYLDFEFVNGIEISFGRKQAMERLVRRLHEAAAFRWSRGPATVAIQSRRVAATTDLQVGQYVLLDIDFLPDPFTHTRGTARLMQCVERSEVPNTPNITLRFIDSGVNIQRSAPTVGAFSQIAGINSASGTISVLQAGRVETSFAVTDQTTTARPDATSSLWTFADVRSFSVSSSQDVVIGELPSDSRVWVRSFIKPNSNQDFELPSDFGFMAAPGYVDITTVLAPPTDLKIFNLTVSGASATWTVGDSTASVEVRMKADSDAAFSNFATLGSNVQSFQWTGRSTLASDNPHKIGIRHRDPQTGTISAEITGSYDITNVLVQIQAPPIGGIFVKRSLSDLF